MEHTDDFKEDDDEMINLNEEQLTLPSFIGSEVQYAKNWLIMKTLKRRILDIRARMIKQVGKLYHENGLCQLFSRVHQQLTQAMDGNLHLMEKDDIQYPSAEEVSQDEVFQHFKSLRIPGVDSIIDIDGK